MIRFVTEGDDGVVLGLGLTEGNLQLLQRDEPIVFDLADQGLAPRTFIIAAHDSTVADELQGSVAGPSTVLLLSASDVDALRDTGLVRRTLAKDCPGVAWALLLYGATEVHILQALSESGLAPSGTEVLGWEQYARDVEREGFFGGRGVVPPEGSWARIEPLSDGQRSYAETPRRRERPLYKRLVASPTAWLFAIVAVAGLLTLLIQAVRTGGGGESKPELQRPDSPMPVGETDRRRLVDRFDPRVFTAQPGDTACPLPVWIPEPLGARPVASRPASATTDATVRLQDAFAWMFDARLMDIAPAEADLLPGLARAIRNAPDGDGWRGARTYATLVVYELDDAEILRPVGDALTREEPMVLGTRTVTGETLFLAPGRVRARLLVWGYAAGAIVCASDPVEVDTPALHLSTLQSTRTSTSEDGVLKARVETLIAAARTAHAELRAVAPNL